MTFRFRLLVMATSLVLSFRLAAASAPEPDRDTAKYRGWIENMKVRERGPFQQIRWFCNDGTVHPPKPYPCKERGGGYQHGEWDEKTQALREQGYLVANILAGYEPANDTGSPAFVDSYNQLLIEKFLFRTDNGWILRKAQFYRGALQEEDERAGARTLLIALANEPDWIGYRYPALRTGAALLPHGRNTASVQKIRQVSASLSDEDPGFLDIRIKIHGSPDAGDAEAVRSYAEGIDDPALKAKYADLAEEIDLVYQAVPLPQRLEEAAKVFSGGPWLQKILRDTAAELRENASAEHQHRVTSGLLAELRDALPRMRSSSARLRVVDISLDVETDNFSASVALRDRAGTATRRQRAAWLAAAVDAAYGTGMLNARGRDEMKAALASLQTNAVSLETYMDTLGYLGRVPGWGTQGLRFHFYESMLKLAEIEPLAHLFIQDQLRGSPLLFFSQVLDGLSRDANRLAGVRHRLFGKDIGVGFRALNPGLTRGTLHASASIDDHASFRTDGIYLLPETISELPPVAGILTAGEGNPLSHVQLLARNLGIPNVGVDEELQSTIRAHDGESVVLAVSPAGLVELASNGPRWDAAFGSDEQVSDVVIRPDLEKLDLSVRRFLGLDELRAGDSGRVVGPKAAKLGELRHAYPDAVARGLAIPFGIFRENVLEKPRAGSGKTVFEWMVGQYRHMEALPAGSEQREQFTEKFRAEVYDLVSNTQLDHKYREQLRIAMADNFGNPDTVGVFVRSDTNVEDLPGFTGAGLNLTLPNVIGFDNVVDAIPRVWASPFTARAFAWRQSHMQTPEHVYPAVLLLQSVSNDKSGVMVTQDIDSGERGILSVAVNEGVGGAVDGQSAESVRIDKQTGKVKVLAMATAPWRRNPVPAGGIEKVPTSGSDTVLQPDEIRQLIAFADELPQRFPSIVDDAGNPAPADIEFGFRDGRLQLFQIRPFLESRKARGSNYLNEMDASLEHRMNRQVNLLETP